MPVSRVPMSMSQFADLVGVEPERVVDVTVDRLTSTVVLVLEPEKDERETQDERA